MELLSGMIRSGRIKAGWGVGRVDRKLVMAPNGKAVQASPISPGPNVRVSACMPLALFPAMPRGLIYRQDVAIPLVTNIHNIPTYVASLPNSFIIIHYSQRPLALVQTV